MTSFTQGALQDTLDCERANMCYVRLRVVQLNVTLSGCVVSVPWYPMVWTRQVPLPNCPSQLSFPTVHLTSAPPPKQQTRSHPPASSLHLIYRFYRQYSASTCFAARETLVLSAICQQNHALVYGPIVLTPVSISPLPRSIVVAPQAIGFDTAQLPSCSPPACLSWRLIDARA